VLDALGGESAPRGDRSLHAPVRANEGSMLASGQASVTWIGHATFLLQLGGLRIATDPVWSPRLSGVVPRLVSPGLSLEKAQPIDLVTVSHNHYDHLDIPTLKRIGPTALYVTPLGNGDLLRTCGLTKVVELEWWQSHRHGDLEITLVPARHWSMRMPWTRNEMLWGGFVFKTPEGTAYHSGDTALFDGFREIGKRAEKIDWAMLPIGAYEPRWFMEPQHMNPSDAGEAFDRLGAENLLAMHWGTFRLTDEPVLEPPAKMRDWWRARGHAQERLWIFDIGETRPLVRSATSAAALGGERRSNTLPP
jgi:L-ascorbate metabolism protein UlaG (beta-lactamase superfamily)